MQPFALSARGARLWPFSRDVRISTLEWLGALQNEPRLEHFHTGESESEEDRESAGPENSGDGARQPQAAAVPRVGLPSPPGLTPAAPDLSAVISRLDQVLRDNGAIHERLARLEAPAEDGVQTGPQLFSRSQMREGGLSAAQHAKLDQLVGRGPQQLSDQRSQKKTLVAATEATLREADAVLGEEQLGQALEAEAGGERREQTLFRLLLQNQSALNKMLERDAKGKGSSGAESSTDPLSVILGGQQGDLDSEDTTRSGVAAARGSAARLMYTEALRTQPNEFYHPK